jgi:hypothetical protein
VEETEGKGARSDRGPGAEQRNELTLENWVSSAFAGAMPRFSQIWPVRTGHDVPAKMSVLRMMLNPFDVGLGGGEKRLEERKKKNVAESRMDFFPPTGAPAIVISGRPYLEP